MDNKMQSEISLFSAPSSGILRYITQVYIKTANLAGLGTAKGSDGLVSRLTINCLIG